MFAERLQPLLKIKLDFLFSPKIYLISGTGS